MDVRFYSYNNDGSLTALGTVDNYSSFMFTRSFSGIGNWKMSISGATSNAQRVKNADIIAVTDGVAGLITDFDEQVNEKGVVYTFSGVELKGLAAKRIIMPPSGQAYLTYTNKAPEEIIAGIITTQITAANEERKLPGSIAGYTLGDDRITFNGRFDSVGDTITNLAETYSIGWYADIQNDGIVWHITHGVDRTEDQSDNPRFILSYAFDTLQSSTLQQTNTLPNVAVVAGQGEGIDRAVAHVGDGIGLKRSEVYIDARDIAEANDLPARGKQKLAEYGDSVVFDITLSPLMVLQYRSSFDLGDIGTVKAAGYVADRPLTEVTEVYEGGALVRIDTVFGADKQTLGASIKRLNSNADTLVKTEGNPTGGGGGSGGLTDYNGLENKPRINGVQLEGNKTTEELGIDIPEAPDIATITEAGLVKPDGTTITVDADGTIRAAAQGGVTSYDNLSDKPKINGNELVGNKSLADLYIAALVHSHSIKDITDYTPPGFASYQSAGLAKPDGITLAVDYTTGTLSVMNPGTDDYTKLKNKPKINNVEIDGNKTSADYFLASLSHKHNVSDITDMPAIPSKTSDLINDSDFITDKDIPGVATDTKAGIVKPDGATITIDADGTMHCQVPESGGVTSFNNRSGAVVPQTGDYTADMVGAATMAQVNAAIQAAILDSWGGEY